MYKTVKMLNKKVIKRKAKPNLKATVWRSPRGRRRFKSPQEQIPWQPRKVPELREPGSPGDEVLITEEFLPYILEFFLFSEETRACLFFLSLLDLGRV